MVHRRVGRLLLLLLNASQKQRTTGRSAETIQQPQSATVGKAVRLHKHTCHAWLVGCIKHAWQVAANSVLMIVDY